MTIDQITNLLVTVTLIEMMITIGLGVTISELLSVARNWRLLAKARQPLPSRQPRKTQMKVICDERACN